MQSKLNFETNKVSFLINSNYFKCPFIGMCANKMDKPILHIPNVGPPQITKNWRLNYKIMFLKGS